MDRTDRFLEQYEERGAADKAREDNPGQSSVALYKELFLITLAMHAVSCPDDAEEGDEHCGVGQRINLVH